ncbi:radical SAM protein [Candidatus Woesearchaeota archaeon]|nr:radical SAM protein [Candidatus Woesearchaeota archaeon]
MNIKEKIKFDNVTKIALQLEDNSLIESVIISQKNTNTICVSTQVGCPVGCKFCKSGSFFVRNLKDTEIIEQIECCEKIITSELHSDKKINIVFMGIGEPLLNLDYVVNVIKYLCVTRKNRISKNRITVSTVGIPEQIIQLANRTRNILEKDTATVNLAISLHFATQAKREKYIPFASKYSISDVFSACEEFYKLDTKSQEIMIEYVMIKDSNDTIEDIDLLIKLVSNQNFKCIINLIPYNGNYFVSSSEDKIKEFKKKIMSNGIKCFIRLSSGQNINAACGMLVAQK